MLRFRSTANHQSNMNVFGLWEEAGVLGENPHRQKSDVK